MVDRSFRRHKKYSTSSLVDRPGHQKNSRAALTQVLLDYNYVGKIVKMKLVDGYGFIRSDQINCEKFFSLHHTTGIDTKSQEQEIVGKNVTFQIKSGAKKKSMEARNVMVVEGPGVVELEGVVVSWVRTGCLIQVTSGLGAEKSHNRIFAPDSACPGLKVGVAGVRVQFRVHMDQALRVEARNVRRTR